MIKKQKYWNSKKGHCNKQEGNRLFTQDSLVIAFNVNLPEKIKTTVQRRQNVK